MIFFKEILILNKQECHDDVNWSISYWEGEKSKQNSTEKDATMPLLPREQIHSAS